MSGTAIGTLYRDFDDARGDEMIFSLLDANGMIAIPIDMGDPRVTASMQRMVVREWLRLVDIAMSSNPAWAGATRIFRITDAGRKRIEEMRAANLIAAAAQAS